MKKIACKKALYWLHKARAANRFAIMEKESEIRKKMEGRKEELRDVLSCTASAVTSSTSSVRTQPSASPSAAIWTSNTLDLEISSVVVTREDLALHPATVRLLPHSNDRSRTSNASKTGGHTQQHAQCNKYQDDLFDTHEKFPLWLKDMNHTYV